MRSVRRLFRPRTSIVSPPHEDKRRIAVVEITLDAEHATAVRQALIRECGNQTWTLRLTPMQRAGRVRLSLQLPRDAISRALQTVARFDPEAEVGRLLEMPETPSASWLGLSQSESAPRPAAPVATEELPVESIRLADLLPITHVLLGVEVAAPQAVFAAVGAFFAKTCGLDAATVTAALAAREAMGSTGLGQGVAVPHGHLAGLAWPTALYLRPSKPIPFDAPDGKPVSDLVVLLVPDGSEHLHLRLLAEVAERFCQAAFREQLRACTDAAGVHALFSPAAVAGAMISPIAGKQLSATTAHDTTSRP